MGARLAGVALLTGALFAAAPAQAQFACTTTSTDITCTNTGTAPANFTNTAAGANQNATTNNSGTALNVTSHTTGGGNATAANSGTANTNLAFTSAGGNATATNSGTVINNQAQTLAGGSATAINTGTVRSGLQAGTLAGGNAIVVNSGSAGEALVGTNTTGNATLINSGTINTAASAGTNVGTATIINSGVIGAGGGFQAFTQNGDAVAINTGTVLSFTSLQTNISGNATVINSGFMNGINTASSGNSTVINSGSIISGVTQHANGLATLTNSGTISNFGGIAVQFLGNANTLNLLAGSNIAGTILFSLGNDTINFASGNHNLTITSTAGPLSGFAVNGPDPFVISGSRAVAIDPTPFGLADRNLMDFTGAVSGLLDGIGTGAAANGPLSSAFAAVDSPAGRIEQLFATIPGLAYASDQAPVFKAPTFVAQDGRAIWARGFGGERIQDPDPQSGMVGAHTQFFGGAVGFDMVARRDLRLGLFAGGGESRLSLDGNLGFTNSDMAFGGIYGRWNFVSLGRDSFLDFSLHGGGGSNSTSRTINNNLVAGGLEIATASYNSSYVSPDLRYGINIPLWAQYTLTPSVRARYVAGFFGGYTEAGTTAPLTVASRTIQDFEERGELKLTRAMPVGPDLLLTSTHIGVLGLERAGDTTVNTTLLGINLPFVTPGKNTVGGLVSGGGFEWRTREGVSFFGAGEGIWFSDQSTVWSAKGGVRVAF